MEMIRRIFKKRQQSFDSVYDACLEAVQKQRALTDDYEKLCRDAVNKNERLHEIALDLDAQVTDFHARTNTILNILMTAPSVKRMNKADFDAITCALTGSVPKAKEAL